MKKISSAVWPGICAAAVCLGANSPTQSFAAVDLADNSPAPAVAPAAPAVNPVAEFPEGKGLVFQFHQAPLENVLTYLSKAAGYVIYLRPGVTVSGTVDAVSAQPLGSGEAIAFLKQVLSDHGLSVMQDGRTLTLLRTADATIESPIELGANPDRIPDDSEVVTQIIPVRNLNIGELGRILPSLLPDSSRLVINESANSLLLTDTHSNVRRAAKIIAALDSVNASANTLKVYPLRFGDTKTVADLIKQLFPAPDTGRAGGNNAAPVVNFPGRRGLTGFPGVLNAGSGGTAADGQTPSARVTAVADEHGNAVIVSAPEAVLPDLEHLISSLDVPVADQMLTEVFRLTNADCVELAGQLGQLYPEDDSSADASGTRTQFNGQGNRGAQAAGARSGTTGGSDGSRMQKLGRVLVVPDPRTGTVLVNAAETLMPQIRYAVATLDEPRGNRLTAFLIHLDYAEPAELGQIVQSVYPAGNTTVASSSTTDTLEQRRISMQNNLFSSGPGSGAANNTSTTFGTGGVTGNRGGP